VLALGCCESLEAVADVQGHVPSLKNAAVESGAS
jgi:hypothetical protein